MGPVGCEIRMEGADRNWKEGVDDVAVGRCEGGGEDPFRQHVRLCHRGGGSRFRESAVGIGFEVVRIGGNWS